MLRVGVQETSKDLMSGMGCSSASEAAAGVVSTFQKKKIVTAVTIKLADTNMISADVDIRCLVLLNDIFPKDIPGIN